MKENYIESKNEPIRFGDIYLELVPQNDALTMKKIHCQWSFFQLNFGNETRKFAIQNRLFV